MNIGLITSSSIPNIGGAEIGLHNIALELKRNGHNPILFTSYRHKSNLIKTNWELPYMVVSFPPGILRILKYLPTISLIFLNYIINLWTKKYKIDIWHGTFGYPIGVILGYCSIKSNLNHIIRCVGEDIQIEKEIKYGMRLDKKINELMLKYFIHSSTFIATTNTVKNEYKKIGIKNFKIRMVKNGVDLKRFKQVCNSFDIRKILGLKNKDFIILMVGRNHEKKNYNFAIDVFKKLSRDFINKYSLKLLIVGTNVSKLDEYIQNEDSVFLIDTAVQFKTNSKKIPSDFILCCYQQSNLFLMTSLIESFGIVLVEAMAANLPIITSNVDGCKDVIRNGNDGLMFKKNDLSDLTHKIKLIVENKKIYNHFKAKSIARARQFDWKNIVKQYLNIYKKLK